MSIYYFRLAPSTTIPHASEVLTFRFYIDFARELLQNGAQIYLGLASIISHGGLVRVVWLILNWEE